MSEGGRLVATRSVVHRAVHNDAMRGKEDRHNEKKTPKSIWIRSVVIITGLTIFIAMGWSMYQQDTAEPPKSAATPKSQAKQSKHTTPTYRSAYHFTVPDKWKNDPNYHLFRWKISLLLFIQS